MNVVFIGVGGAFATQSNNCHLIASETKLLLDCGFSTPINIWKYSRDAELIDAVYITHQHADHSFGLAAILCYMNCCNRRKPIKIICHKNIMPAIKETIRIGYPEVLERPTFKIEYVEITDKTKLELNELKLTFQITNHSRENHAIRIDDGQTIICYSGDGIVESDFYQNADLLIQEAYTIDEEIEGHVTVKQAIETARKQNVKNAALTHIRDDHREKLKLKKLPKGIFVPEQLTEYKFNQKE